MRFSCISWPQTNNLFRNEEFALHSHLTQADVARELSVSPGFISNVENGRTAMSLRLLIYYAKLTGTTLDMLVGDMIPEYRDDALDHAVMDAVKDLSAAQKEKLVRILEILKE